MCLSWFKVDDLAQLSQTHSALQELTNNLHEQREKSQPSYKPREDQTMTAAQDQNLSPIIVGEDGIEYFENFPYLGSNISNTGYADKDVQTRIGKAAGVF